MLTERQKEIVRALERAGYRLSSWEEVNGKDPVKKSSRGFLPQFYDPSLLTEKGRDILERLYFDTNRVSDYDMIKANLIGEIITNNPEYNTDKMVDAFFNEFMLEELHNIKNMGW